MFEKHGDDGNEDRQDATGGMRVRVRHRLP